MTILFIAYFTIFIAECRFVLQKFPQYFLVPLQMSLDDGGTSLRGSLLRSVHESVNSGVGFATRMCIMSASSVCLVIMVTSAQSLRTHPNTSGTPACEQPFSSFYEFQEYFYMIAIAIMKWLAGCGRTKVHRCRGIDFILFIC